MVGRCFPISFRVACQFTLFVLLVVELPVVYSQVEDPLNSNKSEKIKINEMPANSSSHASTATSTHAPTQRTSHAPTQRTSHAPATTSTNSSTQLPSTTSKHIKLVRKSPIDLVMLLILCCSLCLLLLMISCFSSLIICADGKTGMTKRMEESQIKDRKREECLTQP